MVIVPNEYAALGAGRLAALALLAFPVAMANPAAAQHPSAERIEAVRQACRSDFISHCSGVQPGGREALQCLQRNAAQLAPACGSAAGAAVPGPEKPRPASAAPQPSQGQPSEQDQLGAVRKACTLDDVMSHCSWIQLSNPELLLRG
jgi:Cysteine rich repeat